MTAARRSVETILALILVLAFFSAFLSILNTVFPSGPGLRDLMRSGGSMTTDAREKPGSPRDGSPGPGGPLGIAAHLTAMRNQVKSRRASEIAWGRAADGMVLRDRDAIQTLDRSNATITFDDSNYLDMGQNSLVIIQRLEDDPALKERRSFLVMVEGDLRGRIAGTGDSAVRIEVATPSAVTRIQRTPASAGELKFKISVHPDRSSTIAVYEGFADVVAQGQIVRVGANQSTVVKVDEAPAALETLPASPVLDAPADGGRVYYRDLPPRIQFAWSALPGAKAYHFILARDPAFRSIVDEDFPAPPRLSHGNLRTGTYYWRVSGLDGTREGAFSRPRDLEVTQDREPPFLEVRLPPATTQENSFRLAGRTEPGARILVGGERVPTNEAGEFEYEMKFRPGINLVIVQAVDPAGNVSFRSQMVNLKF